MIRLLTIEWFKNRKSSSFWILLAFYGIAAYVACSLGTIVMNASFDMTTDGDVPPAIPDFNIYRYPDIWHNLTYISSFVKVFLGIIVISAISSEMSQRTMKQNIIDGMSKAEFLISKYSLVLTLALISTVLVTALIMYFGSTYGGEVNQETMYDKIDFIGGHFVQMLIFLSFSMLIGFAIKSTGLAIVFTISWTLFLETFLSWMIFGMDNKNADFLPIHAVDNLVQKPFSITGQEVQTYVDTESIIIGVVWAAVCYGLSYLLLVKRDL